MIIVFINLQFSSFSRHLRVHDVFALSWTHVDGVIRSFLSSCTMYYRIRGDKMEVALNPMANYEKFGKKPVVQ